MQSTETAAHWRVNTVTVSGAWHRGACEDLTLLATLKEIVPREIIQAAEERIHAPRCHYGTVGCTNTSDDYHECRNVKPDAYDKFREIAKRNPTLSTPVAHRNAGHETCNRCGGVVTMSNHAVHEAGECWPRRAL